jgi:hypothetical protein
MIDFRKVKDIKDLRSELWISIKHWWNLGQKYKDIEVDKKSFMYGFYIGRHDSYLDIWKGLNSENTEGVSDGDAKESCVSHGVSLATRSGEDQEHSEPSVEGALASTTDSERVLCRQVGLGYRSGKCSVIWCPECKKLDSELS